MKRQPEQVLETLKEHAEQDPSFTKEEIATLKTIIEAYRAWSVLGKATKGFIAFLVLVSAGITVVNGLLSWIRHG